MSGVSFLNAHRWGSSMPSLKAVFSLKLRLVGDVVFVWRIGAYDGTDSDQLFVKLAEITNNLTSDPQFSTVSQRKLVRRNFVLIRCCASSARRRNTSVQRNPSVKTEVVRKRSRRRKIIGRRGEGGGVEGKEAYQTSSVHHFGR